jgi:hypothetical protein
MPEPEQVKHVVELVLGVRRVRHLPNHADACPVVLQKLEDVARWCGGRLGTAPRPDDNGLPEACVFVPTPQGERPAWDGDFVIRRHGRHWPITAEDFANAYVDEPREAL